MVTKRIRSEYMKKFKDPKWETYTKCYEEMLRYRLTRRLLEHAHNPWFWSGADTDSDSGGRSPPPPPPPSKKNQVRGETSRGRTEVELEECEGSRAEYVPGLPLQEEEEEEEEEAASHGSQLEGAGETGGGGGEGGRGGGGAAEEEREEQTHSRDREREPAGPRPPASKTSKPSRKHTWRSQRVGPAPTRRPGDADGKESRHPFALYGAGEKDADMASRKTHNVGPMASTTEIHESALRAKTRREVGRQIQNQRTERRRAKSAGLDKARKSVQPEFNPWLTEYMRCFSARCR